MTQSKNGIRWVPLGISVLIGILIWYSPSPNGVEAEAWQLFAIFVATIVGLVTKPMAMGSVAVLGLTVTVLTGTLNLENALSGFQNTTIWLIVIAFFISRGFIKTGLGARIAYMFVRMLGKKTLGLSYGLVASDLILAPAMPSNTARAGGIIFPIIRSLSETYGSRSGDGTERKVGAFLTTSSFQSDMVTSAMFLTAMAANPLAARMAEDITGVSISWGVWFAAASVPGLLSLVLIPLIVYWVYPPEVKETPAAAEMAADKLKEMGRLKPQEWSMIAVFFLLLVLWIFGGMFGLEATAAAFVGLSVLLLTQVLTWEDIKQEHNAWDTLIWFAVLVMMATYLNELGMIPWFSDSMSGVISGIEWVPALGLLAVVYYYSHYFFASNTAHVSAMYPAFLSVIVAAGSPPLLSALLLGFFSNLFGSLTHYGSGPAPVFFGSGYVSQQRWWAIGLLLSVIHLIVWFGIGAFWWKLIGIY